MSTKRTSATHNTAYKQVMSQYGKRKLTSPSPSLKGGKLRTLEKRRKLFLSLQKQAKALGLKFQPVDDSSTESGKEIMDTRATPAPTTDVQTTPTTNPTESNETDAGNDNHTSPPFQVIAPGGAEAEVTRSGSFKLNLYGNPDSIYPKMPILAGSSPVQFSDWMAKALSYFQNHGVLDLVKLPTKETLLRFLTFCGVNVSPIIAIQTWMTIQNKIIGGIKAAVEPAIGLEIFEVIEKEQEKVGILEIAKISGSNMAWLDSFKEGNLNYAWERLKIKQLVYTEFEHTRIFEKILALKWDGKSHPSVFKRQFNNLIKELTQAGSTFPEKIKVSIWVRALPDSLSSMRQMLGAKSDCTVEDIYQAMLTAHTSLNKGSKNPKDQSLFTPDTKDKTQKKSKIICFKCGKKGHKANECRNPKISENTQSEDEDEKGKGKARSKVKPKVRSFCFADCDIINQFSISDIAMPNGINNNDGEEEEETHHFILDSGATSHVAISRRMFSEIKSVPESLMSTAIKGNSCAIRERGTVYLNDKWKLTDVAYVKNGAANLISEGRIVDAGYGILKGPAFASVLDGANKTVIKFRRVNKLWIYTKGGDNLSYTKPINTLISRRGEHARAAAAEAGASDSEDDSSSPSSSRSETNPSASSSSNSTSSSNSQTNGRANNSQAPGSKTAIPRKSARKRRGS